MNRINQELIEAVRENNVPDVRHLLSVGADANTMGDDDFDDTALHKASLKGYSQVVKELLEHGADSDAKDIRGKTPLHWTCWNGHLAVVNELMSPNDSNDTATILGKRKNRGADIGAKDRDGNTPLHSASLQDHLPVVKALLSGGADVLAANNYGLLPIDCAVSKGNSEVAKCLLQHFYATCRLPLHELLEDLTWIVNPGVNDDPPPLRAAFCRNVVGTDAVVEILEYLVAQNPASLSFRDQDGSLPLHVACRRGPSFTIIQFLVNRYGASVKSVTCQGNLPLFLACDMSKTSLDTIFLLMKLYPDLVYR
jgi:ankyrin repeat protein